MQGIIDAESKSRYLALIDRFVDRGAEGLIAGCTEIELLVAADDVGVPYFPTTRLHAHAAVDWSLQHLNT